MTIEAIGAADEKKGSAAQQMMELMRQRYQAEALSQQNPQAAQTVGQQVSQSVSQVGSIAADSVTLSDESMAASGNLLGGSVPEVMGAEGLVSAQFVDGVNQSEEGMSMNSHFTPSMPAPNENEPAPGSGVPSLINRLASLFE
ncbi:MAG: hypothetical protein ACI38Q_05605 [Candidatus Bruticola sp.]